MQTLQNQEQIKAKIAELRQGYAKLKVLCGPRGVSQETVESYREAIKRLETQLTN